jgi:DNA-directed RNA polymerase subunit M/transcription elongation factor TFIIS
MKCPKCGSENVTIEMMQSTGKTAKHGAGLAGNINNAARAITAISTLGMSNLVWKKSKGTEKTKFKNVKICLCQNCGNSWEIK